jgi:hypothetical protein
MGRDCYNLHNLHSRQPRERPNTSAIARGHYP